MSYSLYEMERYCTPEQMAKADLLEVYVHPAEGKNGYWLVKPEPGGMLLVAIGGGLPTHYFDSVDEALEVAANPAKRGLKWREL